MQPSLDQRNGQTFRRHFFDHEPQAVLGAEALGHAARRRRRTGNAQVNVQTCDVVALAGKLQHKRQRIFAARKRHQHAFFMAEEVLSLNAARHLPGKKFFVARGAKGRIVAAQGHRGLGFTDFTLHERSVASCLFCYMGEGFWMGKGNFPKTFSAPYRFADFEPVSVQGCNTVTV